jgi:hypothetical protein
MQAYSIDKTSFEVNIILSTLIGIGFNAYIPIAMQSFIESNYPSSELALSTSILVCSSVISYFCLLFLDFLLFNNCSTHATNLPECKSLYVDPNDFSLLCLDDDWL